MFFYRENTYLQYFNLYFQGKKPSIKNQVREQRRRNKVYPQTGRWNYFLNFPVYYTVYNMAILANIVLELPFWQ